LLATPEFLAPQMISVPVPDCDVMDLKQKLLDDYNVEVPVFRWNNHCIVRVSMQGYNTAADANCLVDALTDIFRLSAR
jgi:isopenicillin-N epimerase